MKKEETVLNCETDRHLVSRCREDPCVTQGFVVSNVIAEDLQVHSKGTAFHSATNAINASYGGRLDV